jgi:hypothetical protein
MADTTHSFNLPITVAVLVGRIPPETVQCIESLPFDSSSAPPEQQKSMLIARIGMSVKTAISSAGFAELIFSPSIAPFGISSRPANLILAT